MRIIDYELGRELRDVGVLLEDDELDDLIAYLKRLKSTDQLQKVYLCDIEGVRFERELTVAVVKSSSEAA